MVGPQPKSHHSANSNARYPRTSTATKLSVFNQLDGYVGAALLSGPLRIPYLYEFHALLLTDAVEVLLLTSDLQARPLRRLADEVAFIAQEQARAIDIDEVFSFTVPMSVFARVEMMTKAHRVQFRSTLNRRLAVVGLSVHAGSIASGLQIRRNR